MACPTAPLGSSCWSTTRTPRSREASCTGCCSISTRPARASPRARCPPKPRQAPAASAGRVTLGPAPPPGDRPHRYVFRLLAADQPVPLKGLPSYQDVESAVTGHTLGEARLTGTYRRYPQPRVLPETWPASPHPLQARGHRPEHRLARGTAPPVRAAECLHRSRAKSRRSGQVPAGFRSRLAASRPGCSVRLQLRGRRPRMGHPPGTNAEQWLRQVVQAAGELGYL